MQCRVGSQFHFESTTVSKSAIQDYAINNNLTPFISMQNHYSIIYREEEREMFPTLKVKRDSNLRQGYLPNSPFL
jgi:aryl-alcohol dehydrogenase-like predicted oxidoreductase